MVVPKLGRCIQCGKRIESKYTRCYICYVNGNMKNDNSWFFENLARQEGSESYRRSRY